MSQCFSVAMGLKLKNRVWPTNVVWARFQDFDYQFLFGWTCLDADVSFLLLACPFTSVFEKKKYMMCSIKH